MLTMTMAVVAATTRFNAFKLRSSGRAQNACTPPVNRWKNLVLPGAMLSGNSVTETSTAEQENPRTVPKKRL
ncbi:hypothetical protein D3C73_1454840 [compost metagenome]